LPLKRGSFNAATNKSEPGGKYSAHKGHYGDEKAPGYREVPDYGYSDEKARIGGESPKKACDQQ
jgi:hypothetical protein